MADGNIIISNVECESLHVRMATIMVDGNIIIRCGTFPKGKLVLGKVSPNVHYMCESTLNTHNTTQIQRWVSEYFIPSQKCWHMEDLECMNTHIYIGFISFQEF